MPDLVSLSMLVCACALGLAHLAVHAPERDHTVAVVIVSLVAVLLVALSAGAAVMLLLLAAGSFRLRAPVVPDRVPEEWTAGGR